MEVYVTQFVLFLLLVARVGALVITAPMFGHQSVPVQIKVGLTLFLAFVLYPMVSASSPDVDLRLAGIVLLALKEVSVGLLLGFVTGLVFSGVWFAGELIGFDVGFSMASVFDPETGQNNPIIGQFMYMALLMVFLAVNGHHFILESLKLTYDAIPVGSFAITEASVGKLVALTGMIFGVGVKLAAPVIVSSFLVNIALAVLSRVAPQMNVFFVSFPLKIGTGLVVLMAAAPMMVFVFKKLLAGFEHDVIELIKVL